METHELNSPNGRGPDPEVRPKRRQVTADYKLRIIEGVEAAGPSGAGAILRREGLCWSVFGKWRRAHRCASLQALSQKRGRKSAKVPLADEIQRLRRENARLQQKLEQAAVIIEVQKKVASILGIPLKSIDDDGRDS
jgi:transposase